MTNSSRRDFLKRSALLPPALSLFPGLLGPFGTALAQSPETKFDLLIKGGEVFDPGQQLRAKQDIGIKNGLIAVLEADIAEDRAKQVLRVSDKLVMPGLIDMHSHVAPQISALGLPADELVPFTATTTYISAGDVGANSFSAYKHWVINQTRSRILAFVHISNIGLGGFPVGEMLNIDYADVDLAAKTLAENTDVVLGVKVRESENVVGTNGLEPLRRALLAVEQSGTGGRVMCHIGGAPGNLSELLDMLRPGDILTHTYSNLSCALIQTGKRYG